MHGLSFEKTFIFIEVQLKKITTAALAHISFANYTCNLHLKQPRHLRHDSHYLKIEVIKMIQHAIGTNISAWFSTAKRNLSIAIETKIPSRYRMASDSGAYDTNCAADWNDRRRLIKINVRFGVELPATPLAWVQEHSSEHYDAILTL